MRALIMAGGTGGHVFPALVVAGELQGRGWQVEWLGSETGMENRLVPLKGIALHRLKVRGLRGGGLLRKLGFPFMLLRAVWQAITLLRQMKPSVVLGFGGFASGPGGLAAALSRRPLIIHEQNAFAGMTNRYLSRLARVTLQAFPGALKGAQVVGNPVRPEIAQLAPPTSRYASHTGALRLLVLGGSQGAVALNEKLPACLAQVFPDEPLMVRHQCGRGHLQMTQACYRKAGLKAEVSEFIDDMSSVYDWADLMICRAGALTVCEVAAAGVPALFIPFPAAVDDHQTHNANFLVKAGAACLLQQSELEPRALAAALAGMRGRESLSVMAEKARRLAVIDSASRIADICQELANG
jgi:UDP-N-acetylglucosamine--N-acetylmuramyl-(pentapeptide) pyrophosphoryl-undecaprenol N-acetylglucosamine transferase